MSEHDWEVAHGDSYTRLNPGLAIRLNTVGAWVVGPEHRSLREAEAELVRVQRALRLLDAVEAPSEATMDMLVDALDSVPEQCCDWPAGSGLHEGYVMVPDRDPEVRAVLAALRRVAA